jgi:hypothetical protein
LYPLFLKKDTLMETYWEEYIYRSNEVLVRLLGWVLTQCDWCPYRKEKFMHRDRHEHRMPWEHEGRDLGDATICERMPKTASKQSEVRGAV